MLIVDAHQDLAWNILTFERDYTLSASETRRREQGKEAPIHNGDTLLGWPEYQRGKVAVIFATLFASPQRRQRGPWDILCYADSNQANDLYWAQSEAYQRLTDDHPDKFRIIYNQENLRDILDHWNVEGTEEHPVGLVQLMENGEGIRNVEELEEWWELGVRIIGPAWAGTRFCGGTREPGPLTPEGRALLQAMGDIGFLLDLSHMDEISALQSLDMYTDSVIASHSNAKSLLPETESNRHLSDRIIRGLIERVGVIGVVPFNRFLVDGWTPSDGRQKANLNHVTAQIDHICQLAGNAFHVGLGTDFDGGFGLQSVPTEIDTIADLQKLIPLLSKKGYSQEDIAAIMGNNWLRKVSSILPETS
ncbi:MAG: membrane dipeptidase [Chloroflexota bacterium]